MPLSYISPYTAVLPATTEADVRAEEDTHVQTPCFLMKLLKSFSMGFLELASTYCPPETTLALACGPGLHPTTTANPCHRTHLA